jgi:prohibitin 1
LRLTFRLDPLAVVEIRRTQGTLANIVSKIIAPQTQESFKIAAARRTVEEAITKRNELKQDFDEALGQRLDNYGILVLDTSVVDLDFSPEFAKAVEDKQIAEQRAKRAIYVAQEAEQTAQADINRAKGKAEAQRLLAETLKAQGGQLVLQKEAIQAWKEGGAQMPKVLVMGGDEPARAPFLFNFTLAGIETAVRSHLLEHVGPQIGNFLSARAAARCVDGIEPLPASSER